ncbi:MAG: hypothetical protein ACP5UI_01380 [Thermoprotei archaeon]|nr:hypothetical protein [TACK group archaeon]
MSFLPCAEGDMVITEGGQALEVIARSGFRGCAAVLRYVARGKGMRSSEGCFVPAADRDKLTGLQPFYVPRSYWIPRDMVARHELPEVFAKELLFGKGGPLASLLYELSARAGIAPFSLGIGGVALLGLGDGLAEVIVYGAEEAHKVWTLMETGRYGQEHGYLTRKPWMDDASYAEMSKRKVNRGVFNGMEFEVVGVLPRGDPPLWEPNGFRKGTTSGVAKIVDDHAGKLYPSIYGLEGPVDRLVVLDRYMVGLFSVGQTVRYAGSLEISRVGPTRISSVVIGAPSDYVVPMRQGEQG